MSTDEGKRGSEASGNSLGSLLSMGESSGTLNAPMSGGRSSSLRAHDCACLHSYGLACVQANESIGAA